MSQIDIFIFFPLLSWFIILVLIFYIAMFLIILNYCYNLVQLRYWILYNIFDKNNISFEKLINSFYAFSWLKDLIVLGKISKN